jgi:hypothetical protein
MISHNGFRELNLVLTLNINPIYPPQRFGVVIFLIYSLIHLSQIIIHIFDNFILLSLSDSLPLSCFYFRMVLHECSNLFVIFKLWQKRHNFQEVISSCSKFITDEQMKKLRKFNILLTIPWTIQIIYSLIFDVTSLKYKDFDYSWVSVCFIFISDVRSWTFLVYAVYLSLTRVIHLAEISYHRSMMHGNGPSNYKIMTRQLAYFVKKKESLMKSLSVLPCLPFSYLLLKTISSTVWMQHSPHTSQSDRLLSFLNAGYAFIAMLEVFCMSYITSAQQIELHESINDLELSISNNPQIKSKMLFVLRQIDRSRAFEYTAWNLFSIQKSILLSFASSLVTFTVLFVDLLNKSST